MRPPANPLYIFLHLPRTAGTSFIETVKAALDPDEYLILSGPQHTTDSVIRELAGLTPARRARLRFLAGDQIWPGIHEALQRSAHYITFLRSPVARVLSSYRTMRHDADHPFNSAINRHCRSFTQYVSTPGNPLVANHMAVLLARRGAAANWNADDCWRVNQAWLERADVNLANCWFVGFQESFERDARDVCGKMGIPHIDRRERRSADGPADQVEISAADVAKCRELNWADAVLYELALIRRGLRES